VSKRLRPPPRAALAGAVTGVTLALVGTYVSIRLASGLHYFWRIGLSLGLVTTAVVAVLAGLYVGVAVNWNRRT
jgi:hypothetical protein